MVLFLLCIAVTAILIFIYYSVLREYPDTQLPKGAWTVEGRAKELQKRKNKQQKKTSNKVNEINKKIRELQVKEEAKWVADQVYEAWNDGTPIPDGDMEIEDYIKQRIDKVKSKVKNDYEKSEEILERMCESIREQKENNVLEKAMEISEKLFEDAIASRRQYVWYNVQDNMVFIVDVNNMRTDILIGDL